MIEFSWKQLTPHISVTLINMHGDADGFTTHTVKFPLTDEGYAQVQQFQRVLKVLPDTIARRRMASLEEICGKVAVRLQLSPEMEADVFEQLDRVIRSDSRFDEYVAMPVAYFIDKVDDQGISYRAQFPVGDGTNTSVGYCQINGRVASSHLAEWA